MIRMLIICYCFSIRSERGLCEEVHLNLAYRWFCRLGLKFYIPDLSTLTKNRHGQSRDNDTLRFVFEKVLAHCLNDELFNTKGQQRSFTRPHQHVNYLRCETSVHQAPSGKRVANDDRSH
jgi:transposase